MAATRLYQVNIDVQLILLERSINCSLEFVCNCKWTSKNQIEQLSDFLNSHSKKKVTLNLAIIELKISTSDQQA